MKRRGLHKDKTPMGMVWRGIRLKPGAEAAPPPWSAG
jgi:hypothetical protein